MVIHQHINAKNDCQENHCVYNYTVLKGDTDLVKIEIGRAGRDFYI
jgi:hypothetical protein